jgi:hypothetical protein
MQNSIVGGGYRSGFFDFIRWRTWNRKSTLATNLKLPYKPCMYLAKSQKQIKMRAERYTKRRQLLHPNRNKTQKYFQAN